MAGGRRVAHSTIVVMVGLLGSALLGFMREVLNARFYGTHWELDTFLAAAAIPTVLFGVFNGALVSALVPVFAGLIAEGNEDQAWSLASTVFNVLCLVLIVCAIGGWWFAPVYVPLIAHGFPGPQLGVAVRMTRWLMPSIITTSLAGVASAMLNAHHRFSAASLQGVAINVVTIGTVLLLNQRIGIFALTLGTTLGLVAQLLVQVPDLLRIGRYRFEIDLKHPGLPAIWQLLGPIIVGSAAGQIALCCDRFFASTLEPGSISGMNYAIRVVGVPLQLFAAAIATVIFPIFSAQFAGSDHGGVQKSVRLALGLVNLITIPAVGLLVAFAHPIVEALFQGGAFDVHATDLCSHLLPFAALGLMAQAGTMVLSRCAFAGRESRWSVVASVTAVLINILLSILFLPHLAASGLLLANAVSQWIQMVGLLLLVRRMVDGLRMRDMVWPALRIVLAAGLMTGAALAARSFGIFPEGTGLRGVGILVLEVGLSLALFIALAALFGVEELSIALGQVRLRFSRVA